MIFLQAIKKYAAEVAHFAIKGGCQVGLQTAGADIAGHHTRAGNLFKDIQDHLALAEAVEEDAHSSQVERVRTEPDEIDRKSTRLNSSHLGISYAVFCLKKKKKK